jgi:hypothetical protein
VTLLSAVMVPVVFAGVFLEARFMLGHGLKEKRAIEAATKVQADLHCNCQFAHYYCLWKILF